MADIKNFRDFCGILIHDPSRGFLLVRIGYSTLAVSVLLNIAPIYWIGGVATALGFILNVYYEEGSFLEAICKLPQLAGRPLTMLLLLYLLSFGDLSEWAQGAGNLGAGAIILVVGAAIYRLPSPLSSTWISNSMVDGDRLSRAFPARSRLIGLFSNSIGWLFFAIGLWGSVAPICMAFFYRPMGWRADWAEYGYAQDEITANGLYRLCLIFLMGIILLNTGLHLRFYARQHLSQIPNLPICGESFILYLRSFAGDADLAEQPLAPLSSSAPPVLDILSSGLSHEETLVAELKRGGQCKVIAVGSSRDLRPLPGAGRIAPLGDNWQSVVSDLISRAKLVVLSVATSEGAMWELVEAMRNLPPDRLVLLVPMGKGEYDEFRALASKELHGVAEERSRPDRPTTSCSMLPEYPTRIRRMPGPLQLLIYFGPDWSPVVWSLGNARPPTFNPNLKLPLRVGMSPVFDRLSTSCNAISSSQTTKWWNVGRFLILAGVTGPIPMLLLTIENRPIWWTLWASVAYAYFGLWLVYRGSLLRLKATMERF